MKRVEVVGTIEEGCRVPLDEAVPVAVDERVRLIVLVGDDEPNAQVMTPRAAEVQGRKPYRSNRADPRSAYASPALHDQSASPA